MNKEWSQNGADMEDKSHFYKEADSLDEWEERKEELGVSQLGYYTIKSSRVTFYKRGEE